MVLSIKGAAIGKVIFDKDNANVKAAWNKFGALSIPVDVADSLGDFGGKVGHAALTLGTAGVEHLQQRGAVSLLSMPLAASVKALIPWRT